MACSPAGLPLMADMSTNSIERLAAAVGLRSGSHAAADVVRLAAYARIASQWAKRHRLEGREDEAGRFYALKNAALRKLSRTGFAQVSVLRALPRDEVLLCPAHQAVYAADAAASRAATGDPLPEGQWLLWNRGLIDDCPDCQIYPVGDYNDLYDIQVRVERLRFGFHLPLREGEGFLPPPDYLPDRQERPGRGTRPGRFRFGSAISPRDARRFPAALVAARIEALTCD